MPWFMKRFWSYAVAGVLGLGFASSAGGQPDLPAVPVAPAAPVPPAIPPAAPANAAPVMPELLPPVPR